MSGLRCVTVADSVKQQILDCPDSAAIVDSEQIVTFSELDRWASSIASRLHRLGVDREVVVALLLPRSARFVAAALGVLRAGGAYLPLDAGYPGESLAFMLRDSGCAVVITDNDHARQVPEGDWNELMLEATPSTAPGDSSQPPAGAFEATDLAYLIYTSGSTGQPKGVELTHQSLLNLCAWHQAAFAVTRADRATQVASLAFDAAVWEIWPHLAAGASIHIPDEETKRDPGRLCEWMVEQGITIAFLPTALAEIAMQRKWPRETALRTLLTGADTLRHYPSSDLPFTVVNNYGPTECTVVTTSGTVRPAASVEELPSIGSPISNVYVHILDDNLQPLPIGEPGELYVGGANLGRGYHNRPELTAKSFVSDPLRRGARMYRTGDIAAVRPDGQLSFFGRADSQVKIRGFRIEPDEIAMALMGHPGVAVAFVGTWDRPGHDLQLVAYVVAAAEARPSRSELRNFLASRVPAHMVPDVFAWIEEVPLTANGKVDRGALPAPESVLARGAPEVSARPRTPVEERMAAIVAELLGLDAVGVDEDFFLLGGHSLLGTQLLSRISEAYNVDLTLRSLFDNSTVEAMSAEIERLLVESVASMSEEEVQELLRS